MKSFDYDSFLTRIYDASPYFGKERKEKDYATPFYLKALGESPSKVLEFVSCTGLLTIPLAEAGYPLDSVDISPHMHDRVRKKLKEKDLEGAVQLHLSDVLSYDTDERYEHIVVPDSFLLALPSYDEQMTFLRQCYELLKPGGLLIMDMFRPWEDIIKKEQVHQCSRFRTEDGELFIVNTHHVIDKESQQHHFHFEHVPYKDQTQRIKHTITYRYLYHEDVRRMLKETGFHLKVLDDTFNFNKYYFVIAEK